jgi:hypothetical protein
MGGVNASLSLHSSSYHLCTGSCHLILSLLLGSLLLTQATKVILYISPAAGSATFEYIYLVTHKCPHKDAIMAYFNRAGREVSVIPCPEWLTTISLTGMLSLSQISLATSSQLAFASFTPTDTMILPTLTGCHPLPTHQASFPLGPHPPNTPYV